MCSFMCVVIPFSSSITVGVVYWVCVVAFTSLVSSVFFSFSYSCLFLAFFMAKFKALDFTVRIFKFFFEAFIGCD